MGHQPKVEVTRRAALALLATGLISPAMAEPQPAELSPSDASRLVSDLLKAVMDIVNRTTDEAERRARLRQVLGEFAALTSISLFLLGANRASASEAQLDAYLVLAPDYIADQFAGQIGELATQSIQIERAEAKGTRGVLVHSTFKKKSDGEIVNIDWLIAADAQGEARLHNVYLNGISPWVVKREEFTSLIRREGFDGLLAELKRANSSG